MTTQQLRCFVEVAKHLSFSRAAQQLYITQPAVSHQIRALEQELGFALFYRSQRRVVLTPAGATFYPDAADLLDRLEMAVRRAQNSGSHFSEQLYIGYTGSLRIDRLPQVYRAFQRRCPGVHIVNIALPEASSLSAAERERPDILFDSAENVDAYRRGGEYVYQRLYTGHYCCVVPRGHPLAACSGVRYEALAHETLILLDVAHCPPQMAQVQAELQACCPQAVYYFSSSSTHTLPMIQGGLGVAVMPDFTLQPLPDLCAVPLQNGRTTEYGVVWRRAENRETVKAFLQALREQYRTP